MEVFLRPLTVEDAAISWRWRNDPVVWQYTGKRPDRMIDETIEASWLMEALQRPDENRYAICLAGTGQYIGNAQFTHRTKHGAQLHLFIGEKKYWGMGIGKKATKALLTIAAEWTELRVIFLLVNKDNEAAFKIYRALDFRSIGFVKSDQLLMELRIREEQPLVSVFMMTYNHAKFLERALDGILNQQTTFPFQIVVGDDASTDKTRGILFDCYIKRPEIFKLIFQKNNIGPQLNQMKVIEACIASKSEYTAFCEGDDFWTKNYKLSLQVDALQLDKSISLCFHAIEELNQLDVSIKSPLNLGEARKKVSIRELAQGNFINTVSVVLRTKIFKQLPYWYEQSPVGDYPLFMICSKNDDLLYLPDLMATYRTGSGLWSRQRRNEILLKWSKVLSFLQEEFKEAQDTQKTLISQHTNVLVELQSLLVEGEPRQSRNKFSVEHLYLKRISIRILAQHLASRVGGKFN